MVTMMSLCFATPATLAPALAPAATTVATASELMSRTTRSKPFLTMLMAIGRPMRPSPMNPILLNCCLPVAVRLPRELAQAPF